MPGSGQGSLSLESLDSGVSWICTATSSRSHPFVHVTDEPPSTKQTLGNNDCRIYPTVDRTTGRLVAVACIDNLVKGAAGQAVQNMNIMFGMPEQLGLEELALYP